MSGILVPGAFVWLPDQPDWGVGQIQTIIGNRVTVNFENAGKRLLLADNANIEVLDEERD